MSGEANGWRVDGLRGWKQGAGGLVNYLYAGGVPVCEFTGGNLTAVNTWGPTGLLARHTTNIQAGTSATTYYAWDGLGNAAQTLDGNSNLTNTFSWDAYGKGVSTSATTDPYSGFGGQWGYYTDSETGLTLCGARFYDSGAGRWLTRDPIGYAGGINLYGYVGGNPLSGVDPSGLRPVDPFDDSPEADADYTSDLNAGPHPGFSGGVKMTGYLLGMIPG